MNTKRLPARVHREVAGGIDPELRIEERLTAHFQRHQDGMYLGSLAGMVLGAVAGLLVIRDHLISSATRTTSSINAVQLTYEIFIAGLPLKGVTEAAAGSPVR